MIKGVKKARVVVEKEGLPTFFIREIADLEVKAQHTHSPSLSIWLYTSITAQHHPIIKDIRDSYIDDIESNNET